MRNSNSPRLHPALVIPAIFASLASYAAAAPDGIAQVSMTKTQDIIRETPYGCDTIPGLPDPDAMHAIPGACVEYKITVLNTGDGPATSLSLSNTLSTDLRFMAAQHIGFISGGPGFGLSTPPDGHDCIANDCSVTLSEATLEAGETGQIIIRAVLK